MQINTRQVGRTMALKQVPQAKTRLSSIHFYSCQFLWTTVATNQSESLAERLALTNRINKSNASHFSIRFGFQHLDSKSKWSAVVWAGSGHTYLHFKGASPTVVCAPVCCSEWWDQNGENGWSGVAKAGPRRKRMPDQGRRKRTRIAVKCPEHVPKKKKKRCRLHNRALQLAAVAVVAAVVVRFVAAAIGTLATVVGGRW